MPENPRHPASDILPRPLPKETVSGLTPPLSDFEYFVGARRFPFQPRPDSFSAINAWWLAEASFLVYGEGDFIEGVLANTPLPDLGFTLQWIGERDSNRGIVLSNEQVMIVVFRGTRMHQHSVLDAAEVVVIDQADLWTDSKFLQTACAVGGKVHHGFLTAYQEICERLDEIVSGRSRQQALWFTGHSLGGALHRPSDPRGLYVWRPAGWQRSIRAGATRPVA